MSDKVILKKYSNRRLYDTRASRYITLEGLTGMIKEGLQVEIIDASTKEDVTAFILTQVVLEEARKKNILLPAPVLHLIIRHGNDALSDFFNNYLQKTIQNYLSYRQAFDEQINRWLDTGSDVGKMMPNMMDAPNPMESLMQMFMPPGRTQSQDGEKTTDHENTETEKHEKKE